MDDFSRHIQGRRGKGRPCRCCVEADKRLRSRLARHRLSHRDRLEFARLMVGRDDG